MCSLYFSIIIKQYNPHGLCFGWGDTMTYKLQVSNTSPNSMVLQSSNLATLKMQSKVYVGQNCGSWLKAVTSSEKC